MAQTFVDLTGTTGERIAQQGKSLPDVLTALGTFSGKAGLWAWGKDEFNPMAIFTVIGIPARTVRRLKHRPRSLPSQAINVAKCPTP